MAATFEQLDGGVIHNLGPVTRIPLGEGRTFIVSSGSVAVFRLRSGEVVATQAWCPHRRGPLADGLIGAGKIVCPLHAYKFELATGRPLGNDCPALRTHQVFVSASGDILLSCVPDEQEQEVAE